MSVSRDSLPADAFKRIAAACSAGVVLLALQGLARRYLGLRLFPEVMPHYIPMASGSAFSLLILGSALFLESLGALSARTRAGARAAGVLVVLGAILLLLWPFPGPVPGFEEKLLPGAGLIGQLTSNRLSPLTMTSFILGGVSLFLILGRKDQGPSRVGGTCGGLVAVGGGIGIIGYLFGRPLFYNGVAIPMAFSTTCAFLLLGAGLMAQAGPGAPPLQFLAGTSTRARLLRVFPPLMVAVILTQAFLCARIPALFDNHALAAAAAALGFALVTGIIAVLVSRTLSRTLDRAEVALRDSEEKYRGLIETTNTGYVILDLDGKVLDANQEYVRLTGHKSREEILGRNIIEWTAEADREKNREEVAKCILNRAVKNLEINYAGRNGGAIPVEINATTITTSEGIKIFSLVRDVTERRQAQAALEESLSLYKVTLESTTDGILAINRQGRIVSANHKFREMWGIPAEVIASGDGDQALAWAQDQLVDPQSFLEKVRELYAQPSMESVDVLHFKDGRVYERYSQPQYLDDEIVGRVLSFRDVTTRTRAEQALRDHSQFLQTLIDTIPSPVFYKDTKGVYLGCNQAYSEFLGLSKNQIIGKTVHGIYPQNLADGYAANDAVLFRQQGVHNSKVSIPHADGSLHDVYVSKATYSTVDDAVAGMVGVMVDITGLKKSEEERLRFSKLESLATLAGGIAHDFNNILTAILGNIGLAMLEGQINGQGRTKLFQAEQACLRAKDLAQQLLTFAKGGAPITRVISLPALLQESASLALSGSRSRCTWSIPGDLWPVAADEGQINQVISNLLINADQAMPEGGIIKIGAANVLVDEEHDLPLEPGKYVQVSVADHGTGISPQYANKVFDPYFTTKHKGSGLGLATAYSIVKKHDGHIELSSRMGAGATFQVYLPASEQGAPALEAQKSAAIKGQGRILAMDDERMVLDVLGDMLAYLGYDAEFAADGSQAVEKFARAQESGRPFAAVILDLTVPGGMGGKEAVREILKIAPRARAIVSSGYSDDPIMADSSIYGFSAVIVKPYRVLELSKVLQKVITGENA